MSTVKEVYQPEWINAKEAAAWLGIEENTLFKWRAKLQLNWTNVNGRTVMYDKKEIQQLLNKNSTYAMLNKNLA